MTGQLGDVVWLRFGEADRSRHVFLLRALSSKEGCTAVDAAANPLRMYDGAASLCQNQIDISLQYGAYIYTAVVCVRLRLRLRLRTIFLIRPGPTTSTFIYSQKN